MLYEASEFREHRGEEVLEFGCATGCDLLQFAKHGARATGVDLTPEHLRLARQRMGHRAQVLYADGRNLPFADESFDYVYSHGVLHHIEEPRKVVEEIFRVLRPSGRFNLHVYAKWSYVPIILILKHRFAWKLWIEHSRDPVHIDLYSTRSLRGLFTPAAMTTKRYEFRFAPALSRYIGWFPVAIGNKPEQLSTNSKQRAAELPQ